MPASEPHRTAEISQPTMPLPVVFAGPALLQSNGHAVGGEFVDVDGEPYYKIANYDRMPPFFMSVVSDADHWIFISSNGALTAGRKSQEQALFPYYTVDKIHDSGDITGGKTLILAAPQGDNGDGFERKCLWEPFSDRYSGIYSIRRNLYKSLLGDKLRFEEDNEELRLTFAVTWCTSDRFGFVRRASLHNHGTAAVDLRVLDGVQNLMPYGVSRPLQTRRSVLADAYKKNELLADIGLGLFTLSARPVDRAEPSEALKATTVWTAGLEADACLLSIGQIDRFRAGQRLEQERIVLGERGAYFVHAPLVLESGERREWHLVAEIEQDAAEVVELATQLANPSSLQEALEKDVYAGTERLLSLLSSSDGIQCTSDEMATARHTMNVLFNIMRGGVFDSGYIVERNDVKAFVEAFNRPVAEVHAALLDALPERLSVRELFESAKTSGAQLERLCLTYLPLSFSRRHGDPSRPWNHFLIEHRDENGAVRRGYQGNWRDIFQNWEALSLSFPGYLESFIAKFVNASTADGYNPYRITQEGIFWEVVDPDDPWSYIGYWGDHQIVYLLRLLELAQAHYPGRLEALLARRIFSYANIPYRIKPYTDLLKDPHNTVEYDVALEEEIARRVKAVGGDGKLLWVEDGTVLLVSLAEKLLVPLLAKLTNFIPEGGIWMNTQRPEWNDANNALVGYGISIVTLFEVRRYLEVLAALFANASHENIAISEEVADLVQALSSALDRFGVLANQPMANQDRKRVVDALGEAGSTFRQTLYDRGLSGKTSDLAGEDVLELFKRARVFIDNTIRVNRRGDGLFHSYNLLRVEEDEISISSLYEMLEGQVAALRSGALTPEISLEVIEALRGSALYREDQDSYMLYPDRQLPGFLEKNNIPAQAVSDSSLLTQLLHSGDRTLVIKDVLGGVHFNGSFSNGRDVEMTLDELRSRGFQDLVDAERTQVLELFEDVFDHRSYTGRSGTFFGYEGLGSIYWHMVSKLILAVQSTFFSAHKNGSDPDVLRRLADAYYELRGGLGVNKRPQDYGAFPIDPYSHTPGHAGAKQPGMTGQVKEDILCRWGELGVRVERGQILFRPFLLRASEFLSEIATFRYFDVQGESHSLALDADTLGFTYCQVPVVYRRSTTPAIRIFRKGGMEAGASNDALGSDDSAEIFGRTGSITRIEVDLMPAL